MHQRKLGSQGLTVSELGLGCMGMSEFYGEADEQESIYTLHRAVELGITMLDTADIYAFGDNERLVGRAIKGIRDRVIVATKFGILRRREDPAFRGMSGRPEYVRQCCEASLRRLGVDVIDLYYIHRVDASIPIEDTVGAMADLAAQGKVRYLGISEAGPATIRRAHCVHPLSALQTEYSLWSRDPEERLLPLVRELGIGFVACSPIGRGFLSGTIKRLEHLPANDFRHSQPRWKADNFKKNSVLVEKLKAIAKAKGCTPAQLTLAWVLAQGADIVPIPGTTRRRHLEENVAASKLVLAPEELAQMDAVCPRGAAYGDRYPNMSFVDIESQAR
ncbi:MAG: aldo/keto reductase [Desulfobacterales bacterium]|jgi:aryl-alcohol dehydrogenase-like predicted oxidoreductase|nr:aldo/keto reductase [Desulfobacterales bacterium]